MPTLVAAAVVLIIVIITVVVFVITAIIVVVIIVVTCKATASASITATATPLLLLLALFLLLFCPAAAPCETTDSQGVRVGALLCFASKLVSHYPEQPSGNITNETTATTTDSYAWVRRWKPFLDDVAYKVFIEMFCHCLVQPLHTRYETCSCSHRCGAFYPPVYTPGLFSNTYLSFQHGNRFLNVGEGKWCGDLTRLYVVDTEFVLLDTAH